MAISGLIPKIKSTGLVGYSLDGKRIVHTEDNWWGFFVTWGLNFEIDITRKRFAKQWKKYNLPMRGILPHDFLEPKAKKCWAIAIANARKAFEAARPDGTQIRLVRLSSTKFEIIRMIPKSNSVKTLKSKVLFDPADPDGPILFTSPEDNADIATNMRECYVHALEYISTHEARSYITSVLGDHCDAALVTQKGGMYYIDMRYVDMLRRVRKLLHHFGNRLGIFPIMKITGQGDIDYFTLLQSIIHYQMRRFFKSQTEGIRRTLDSDHSISIRLANKYRDSLKQMMIRLKYYARRFGLLDVYIELKAEKKAIKKAIANKASTLNFDAVI